MQSRTKILLTILLPIQIIGIQLLSLFPEFIEEYYSNGIYVYISRGLRYTFGWLPFSFGDIAYIILIIFLLRYSYLNIIKRKPAWKTIAWDTGATCSILYACFHLLWGMNYYRVPLYKTLHLDDQYTQQELISVTEALIKKANAIHEQLEPNDSLPINSPYTKEDIFDITKKTYEQASIDFPSLKLYPQSIKNSLISLPLTYMGFSGYLNPVTNEAQVNSYILNYRAPTTSCHEQAHQAGYAKENEANFIAAIITIHDKNPYFKYSGLTFALKFCLNDLYKRDEQIAMCLADELRPGIRENYREINAFWESYQNPIEPYFKSTYDRYLKINNQPNGMESYNYMVALLVNYLK
ncbi:DUF3810 domain-containing protein [Aquimarina intermedia]|uniref:Uncharacterized protein DUF3810 n=1 Tax=Aquimarina intermedia TaxID=350814 RepID=A0A5S5C316_9FLAO|nr:DUF3810 domain-containing protein [Aquimarina intermedia]TYP72872.1 uncharacterized protein DUF3810 [Aquimarina intermedia]